MTAIEVTEKIQDGVLKAVETSQAWTLGALRSTSSAFDGIKPDPSLIPFADKVPMAAETLDVTFAFWGKLLDAQHAFLVELSTSTCPPSLRPRSPTSPHPRRSERSDLSRAPGPAHVAPRPTVAGGRGAPGQAPRTVALRRCTVALRRLLVELPAVS